MIHDGKSIPKDLNPWDPNASEWLTIVWDADVACKGNITSSSWLLPTGWTNLDEREDVPVLDCDSTAYEHANQVLLSTTEVEGIFTFTNRVTFTDTTSLDRSVKIKVKAT